MRRILVEAARRKAAEKRGGCARAELSESSLAVGGPTFTLIDINHRLAAVNPGRRNSSSSASSPG